MKKSAVTIVLAIALLLGIAYGYWRSQSSRPDVVHKVFGGHELYAAFHNSRTATAQRLHWRGDQSLDRGKLNGYAQDAPVPIAAERVQELLALLHRPSSYDWGDYTKSCIIDYAVLLTFSSGQRVIRVALCFKCNELGIFAGEDNTADSINTEADFDPVREQLLAIVKPIYPNDQEIQGLK